MIQDIIDKVIAMGDTECGHSGSCVFCEYEDFCKSFRDTYMIAKEKKTIDSVVNSVVKESKDASSN